MKKPVVAFVRHQDARRWEALGWTFHDTPEDIHAAVGSMYRWGGAGEPEYPIDADTAEAQLAAFDYIWPGSA